MRSQCNSWQWLYGAILIQFLVPPITLIAQTGVVNNLESTVCEVDTRIEFSPQEHRVFSDFRNSTASEWNVRLEQVVKILEKYEIEPLFDAGLASKQVSEKERLAITFLVGGQAGSNRVSDEHWQLLHNIAESQGKMTEDRFIQLIGAPSQRFDCDRSATELRYLRPDMNNGFTTAVFVRGFLYSCFRNVGAVIPARQGAENIERSGRVGQADRENRK